MKNAYTTKSYNEVLQRSLITKSYNEVVAPWLGICYTVKFGVISLRKCGLCPGTDTRQRYPDGHDE